MQSFKTVFNPRFGFLMPLSFSAFSAVKFKNIVISLEFVMVNWMHNNAIDLNNIGRTYNHRGHRGTQRIDLTTLCSRCPLWLNPVAFTACVGSI